MLALFGKLFTNFLPFLKEVILGNKRIKKQERNINIFLIVTCCLLFFFIIISSFTNSKLITVLKEQEKEIVKLKEENKTLSNNNLTNVNEINILKSKFTECVLAKRKLDDKILELESLDCEEEALSLSHKLKNLDNGVCHLEDINLKHNMPPIPKISRLQSNDQVVGDILIEYIGDLRTYIKDQDNLIETEKDNCK